MRNLDALCEIRAALDSAAPGSPSVKIGVVDGLPDLTHPTLKNAPIEILGTMIPDGASAPDSHGTRICSVIFGNGKPVAGIAPACSGLVLPIFFGMRAEGRPRPASQLDLARAIEFALENGVSIINVSAGQKVAAPAADTHLDLALRHCAESRVLVISAAGNDGCACLHLPASIPSVLAVGATDAQGRPLEISNWGAPYRQNGILAPGDNLTVADFSGGIAIASGTSYATAVVSGVAALLLSVAIRESYRLDAIDIQRILLDSAVPCESNSAESCDQFLVGRLDAAAALTMVHRIGAKGQQLGNMPLSGAVVSQNYGQNSHMRSSAEGGYITMPNSDIQLGETASSVEQGVTPAGGRCQNKANDELEKTSVKQQSARGSVAASPSQADQVGGLTQQACSCGRGQPPQMVYAIGSLWFDFGTEARHDLFVQQLGGPMQANNPAELIGFVRKNQQFAAGLTFILMQEQIPLYAIQPAGPFALQTYDALFDAILSALNEGGSEQRISLPGFISGSTRLLNGMAVPVVFPDLRGMYQWRSEQLIEATRAIAGEGGDSDEAVLNFLNRVYYELRNLGVSPQDRAINFAATNAYQARQVFADAAAKSFALDSIRVVKSPICRPDSDCWDVELVMFDDDDERRPNRVYRYTVDVAEVVPVTVGKVRSWAARAGS